AWPSRRWARLLPLQLSRQPQDLCRCYRAGSAGREAGGGGARSRRLSARLLREARRQIPDLHEVACQWCTHPDGIEELTMIGLHSTRCFRLPAGVAAIVSLCLLISSARAQQTFNSPDDAASAL